jgi:glutamyl-tRNA reductase
VRSETAISHHPASISSLAVQQSAQIVGSLDSANVLIIGAGEMAELAVAALVQRGVGQLTAVNRTLARAERVANRWGARARPYEALSAELRDADIVITSTAAPHTVVKRDAVAACMAQRPDRPLALIDIAVPRDVEPSVAEIPAVHLLDIDDLGQELSDSLASRRREIPAAESIIAEELQTFRAWLDTLPVTPLIRDLRSQAEEIRCREVERTLRRMPDIGEEDRDRIEQLSRCLVKKLLHAPTLSLKRESQNGNAALFATVARQLFDLEAGQSLHQIGSPRRLPWPASTESH